MERDRRGERRRMEEGRERRGKERREREREHKSTRSKGSPWASLNLGSRLKRHSQSFGRKIHVD